MTSTGFCDIGLIGAAQALARNAVTAEDLAQTCIDQVARYESDVAAWVSFDADLLLEHARVADEAPHKGVLHGLPVGVKDIFNTKDFPTQMGSPLWTGFTPGNDARPVFNIQRAGAIVAGKTVTAEFAVHALGETKNPHNADRTPGTSSSGSAAAVAAGMVPAALGTQTAGSIIRPASFCGVYGFKPSFGLIPRTGMLKTTDSLDSVGFFVNHAADMDPMLHSLRVHGADYPMIDRAFGDSNGTYQAHAGRWRVAVVEGPAWGDAEPYAKIALMEWARQLDGVSEIEVVECPMPSEIADVHGHHQTIYDTSLAYYFRNESAHTQFVSPIMNEIIERGRQNSVDSYRDALTAQEAICRKIDACFDDVDFIVTLSTAGAAPLRDEVEKRDSALVWTFLHLPAISAPVFLSKDGLPFGLQIVGRRYSDRKMMQFVRNLVEIGLLPKVSPIPGLLQPTTLAA